MDWSREKRWVARSAQIETVPYRFLALILKIHKPKAIWFLWRCHLFQTLLSFMSLNIFFSLSNHMK